MAKRQKKCGKPAEIEELRARLAELESTLDAIRSGEVDALVVRGPRGNQVYSLKGAEEPYRAFIEQMHEGAVTLDTSATVLYCNRHFAEMVQAPLERVIGACVLDHIAEEDRPLAKSLIADDMLGTANIMLEPRGGKPFPVRFTVSPLETQRGMATRCLVVADLTEQHERKMLSLALKKLRRNQLMLKKQYQQMRSTRTALEAASAAKDEFLAALSHELRTPLTPVLLTANALAVDPSLPNDLRSDIDMICRNVELEARLIDDLLDLTRITRGKLRIAAQPIDLHEVIATALDICQSDGFASRLHFVVRLGADAHWVEGEAVRLQQIFWNLIRNAVKFTPESGTVTITSENGKRAGRGSPEIRVTVRDTGIGIPRGKLSRIFNAFEQGSGEITRRFGGLGLGLTITRQLVELHGGTITAASEGEGAGAVFTVTLPTIHAPAPSPSRNDNDGHPKQARRLRILLVEDHDDTRRNMARLLTALGHAVAPAADAASALHQAQRQSFDLVISDIGLPDESGLELMKKLRSRHRLKGICLSGYGMEEDIAKSRRAGFSEHLVKPINFQRLERAIAQITSSAER